MQPPYCSDKFGHILQSSKVPASITKLPKSTQQSGVAMAVDIIRWVLAIVPSFPVIR
jgi:hypothetical protein